MLEPVQAAFDRVAMSVGRVVEAWWPVRNRQPTTFQGSPVIAICSPDTPWSGNPPPWAS
jgi:hypothetical protein